MSSKKKDTKSSTCSPVSGELVTAFKQPDLFKQSHLSSQTSTAKACSKSIGHKQKLSIMSNQSKQTNLPGQMLSAVGSPALTSVSAVNCKASMPRDRDYGQSLPELLASYDPDLQSWRTSQTCLMALLKNEAGGLGEFSETWPRSGMMQNGIAYHLPTLAAGQGGTEYGYLPTPTAVTDPKGSPRNRYYGSATYRSLLREYLRDGEDDPIYPNPRVSEAILGYPQDYTLLETQLPRKSLQLLDEQLSRQTDEL